MQLIVYTLKDHICYDQLLPTGLSNGAVKSNGYGQDSHDTRAAGSIASPKSAIVAV
jgi:hypothetical protein